MKIKRDRLIQTIIYLNLLLYTIFYIFRLHVLKNGSYEKYQFISTQSFEIIVMITISVLNVLYIVKKIKNYHKIKNLSLDLYIDCRGSKRMYGYIYCGLIIFSVLLAIGLANVLGFILLFHLTVWIAFEVYWMKKQDGFYNQFILYQGKVFFIKNIKSYEVNKNQLMITVSKKGRFFEVIHTLNLIIVSEDIKKLMLLLESSPNLNIEGYICNKKNENKVQKF